MISFILWSLFSLVFAFVGFIVFLKYWSPNLNVFTGLDDLERLGKAGNKKNKKLYGHAIVCGGSISGSFAARALLNHFETVTIIDQDDIEALVKKGEPQTRPNVPHQEMFHAVFYWFTLTAEKLFPGIIDLYKERGAKLVDAGIYKWYMYEGFLPEQDLGKYSIFCSRILLEFGIQKMLHTLYSDRITYLHGSVCGLIGDKKANVVQGVQVRLKKSADEPTDIYGDFVVDATGKASKGVKWLSDLGYATPPLDEYEPFVAYATRKYKKPDFYPKDKPVTVNVLFQNPNRAAKNGYLAEIENDQIIVLGAGLSKEVPDSANFEEWAKGFISPCIHEDIIRMEPIGPVQTYRGGKQKIVEYYNITTPSNFIAVADAFVYFNPVYGQGISIAAANAVVLDAVFNDSKDLHISSKFFSRMKKRVLLSWMLPKALDLLYKNTSPKDNSLIWSTFHKVLPVLFKRACQSKLVHKKFIGLLSMTGSPLEFFEPRVLWEIIKYSF